jgi:hypothetical protein
MNELIGNWIIPGITLLCLVLILVYVIINGGLRGFLSFIVFIACIGVYFWYTKSIPDFGVYNYILNPLKSKLLWELVFLLLIIIIQYYLLFDLFLRKISRSFNIADMFLCVGVCIFCNILLAINFLSFILPSGNFKELLNPFISTGVMMMIYVITYVLSWVMRLFNI